MPLTLSGLLSAHITPPIGRENVKMKVELYSHVPVMRNVLDQLKVCARSRLQCKVSFSKPRTSMIVHE